MTRDEYGEPALAEDAGHGARENDPSRDQPTISESLRESAARLIGESRRLRESANRVMQEADKLRERAPRKISANGK